MNGLTVFDLEANGFLRDATRIHCIATRNLASRVEHFFGPNEIEEGLDFLSQCDVVAAHNSIGYDLPLIKKLYPDWLMPLYEDTLILSRLYNPDRKGGHSIEAWGEMFHHPKPEHEDWTTYSEAMGNRCIEDTRILAKVVRHLNMERGDYDWTDAIRLEYKTQWLQNEIEERGVNLSPEAHLAADKLQGMLEDTQHILNSSLPLLVKPKGMPVTKPFTNTGKLAKRVTNILGAPLDVGGPFSGVVFEPLNLNSSKQLNEFLLSIGWKPTEFNYKKAARGGYELNEDGTYMVSSPKVTEDSLEPLNHPVAQHLKEYRILKHRLSILRHTKLNGEKTGWCNTVRDDHRVEAIAIPLGTNTHRYTHQNIVNLPSVGTPHSEYIRSMLIPTDGMILAGTDATNIQARLGGHYAYPYDGGEYGDLLLSGDFHTRNAEAFSQVAGDEITRKQAKGIGYALSFGAQVRKIATMMGCSMALAEELINAYWEGNPGLAEIVEKCRVDSKRGYLIGLDGRKIFIRSPHSSFNALLQSAEAVIMKHAFTMMGGHPDQWKLILTMHDEWLAEMEEKHQSDYGLTTGYTAEYLNAKFDMKVPIEFDTTFGYTYADTH